MLNELSKRCHEANKTWWVDLKTGETKDRNTGELLMLCVSELAEAMEGHRKSLPDDKLPHRSMFEVELADCLIRIFDLAGARGLDLDGAFEEKMAFNAIRQLNFNRDVLGPALGTFDEAVVEGGHGSWGLYTKKWRMWLRVYPPSRGPRTSPANSR